MFKIYFKLASKAKNNLGKSNLKIFLRQDDKGDTIKNALFKFIKLSQG